MTKASPFTCELAKLPSKLSSLGVEIFRSLPPLFFRSFPEKIDFQAVLRRALKLPPFFPGSSITVWYFAGRFSGPPPTSMYFWFSILLQLISARVLASSRLRSLVGVLIARDLGLILPAVFGVSCPVTMRALYVGNLSLNMSSQYLMRYSVTTACTPTPWRAATPPTSRDLQRSKFGAHTIATFLAVIPVSLCFWATR